MVLARALPVLALVVMGCNEPIRDAIDRAGTCASDADCLPGQRCVSGTCVATPVVDAGPSAPAPPPAVLSLEVVSLGMKEPALTSPRSDGTRFRMELWFTPVRTPVGVLPVPPSETPPRGGP